MKHGKRPTAKSWTAWTTRSTGGWCDPCSDTYKRGPNKGKPKPGKLLEKECSYIADFSYFRDGKFVVEDTKGVRTEVYKIKRKLMLERYGIRISEV